MSELKSCPFCGGDVDMLRAEVDEVGEVLYMPRCRECRAAILMKGQGEYTAYKSAEAAAAAWNTRHVETCSNERGRCSACGSIMYDAPNYCAICGRKVEG